MSLSNLQPFEFPSEQEIFEPSQELHDITPSGKIRDWRYKKERNELLAAAYDSVDRKKAARLRDCGKLLRFRLYPDGKKVLDAMTSCRVRLCPICSWRRSLKIYGQTKEIVDHLAKNQDLRYVMLTLTVRNCTADKLSSTLDTMLAAWHNFMRTKAVSSACKGWYRSLEIVHDMNPVITPDMYHGNPKKHVKARGKWYQAHGYQIGDPNPNFDTYHPHFHVLIAVSPSYFCGREYISQKDWSQTWQNALHADYSPRVDVRCVKGSTMDEINHAVAEVAKYACKDSDVINPDDWDLTVDTVRTLDAAISRRRLVAYGGAMRDARRFLQLDDVEDGDLVHVGDDEVPESEKYVIVAYWWYSGYRQYYEL